MSAKHAAWSDVLALAPELEGVPEAVSLAWGNVAAMLVPIDRFGECSQNAHALLWAHYVSTAPSGGPGGAGGSSGGAVASMADGPASISFAVTAPSADDASLADSTYGKRFLEIRAKIRARGAVMLVRRRSCWPGGRGR